METIIFIFFVILTLCSLLILAHKEKSFIFTFIYGLMQILMMSWVTWILASCTNSVHGTDICVIGSTIVVLICFCISYAGRINAHEMIEKLEVTQDLTGLTEDEELLLTNYRKIIQGRE